MDIKIKSGDNYSRYTSVTTHLGHVGHRVQLGHRSHDSTMLPTLYTCDISGIIWVDRTPCATLPSSSVTYGTLYMRVVVISSR